AHERLRAETADARCSCSAGRSSPRQACFRGAAEAGHCAAAAILETEPARRKHAESVDAADRIVGSGAKRAGIGRAQHIQGFLVEPAGGERLLPLDRRACAGWPAAPATRSSARRANEPTLIRMPWSAANSAMPLNS